MLCRWTCDVLGTAGVQGHFWARVSPLHAEYAALCEAPKRTSAQLLGSQADCICTLPLVGVKSFSVPVEAQQRHTSLPRGSGCQHDCAWASVKDTGTAGMSLVLPLQQQLKLCCWRRTHAVSGCFAGLASTFTLQPLDVVKTRLQGRSLLHRGFPHVQA